MPPKIDLNVFVLQPCRIRQGQFVPTKDEALTVNWTELVKKFSPQRLRNAVLCLRHLRMGGFVGLAKSVQGPAVFYYSNLNRNGKISTDLVKDDKWSEKIIEVYRVEKAQWATKVIELQSA